MACPEENIASRNVDRSFLLIAIISAMLILTAAGTAMISRPGTNHEYGGGNFPLPPDLETIFPDNFSEWSRVPLSAAVLPSEAVVGPGEAVVYRAYRNKIGRVVTLVVAYGPPASDSVRLHRPETCYTAQGYFIRWHDKASLRFGDITIPLNRLMASNTTRHEVVSYWLRAGDDYAVSAAAHQWINLQQGLGKTAEGVLVRISSGGRSDSDYNLHEEFMGELLAAMQDGDRSVLIVE